MSRLGQRRKIKAMSRPNSTRIKRAPILAVASLAIFVLFGAENVAAEGPFEKFKLSRSASKFLVLKDVNVRMGPKTKSKRIGRLRRGVVVAAIGKAKGTEWVAVRKDGKDFGFVYGTALVPMIDGALKSPLKGTLNSPSRPVCRYSINFEEKFKVQGDNQITSDYFVPMECKVTRKAIKIKAAMFITELPYLDQKKEIYQINVDLLGIPLADEDVLSAIILYDAKKNLIAFDGLSSKEMRGSASITDQKVNSVPDALRGALTMAHSAWGKKLWAELISQQKK